MTENVNEIKLPKLVKEGNVGAIEQWETEGKVVYYDEEGNRITDYGDKRTISKKIKVDEYKKKDNHYIDKKEFLAEILKSKQQDKLTPRAEKLMCLLGERFMVAMKRRNTKDPEIAKDCLQEGYHNMFKKWREFDSRRTQNAFAYFTQIFKTGTANAYNKINKKKGDPNYNVGVVSYNNTNDGEGMFNVI